MADPKVTRLQQRPSSGLKPCGAFKPIGLTARELVRRMAEERGHPLPRVIPFENKKEGP